MKLFRQSLCILLALTMLIGICAIPAFAEDSADSDSTYYHGAFYYRPGTGEFEPGTEFMDYYAYSDDYFKQSGKVYNPHLCTLSFALAEASVNSTREPFTEEGYKNKNRNAVAFIEDVGFSNIKINDAYRLKPTKDSVGIACGRKQITDGDKEYTLLVVFPRSAGYEAEWGNNFVLGAQGDASGFDGCADKCLAFAKDYIAEQGICGDIKVWTVGYSRGASIANLIAKKLIDAPKEYLGSEIELAPENLYAYTCGTPSAADVRNDPRSGKYAGIFNRYLDTEFASAMPPIDMGFERYGTDRLLYNADKYDEMLYNLSIENDYVYNTYKSSINSNLFTPKKLGFSDGSIGMVDDPDSYIPADAAEYLRGLCQYLTEFTGGRENFSAEYEQPFSDLLAYYESLTGDNATAFTSTIGSDEDTLYLVVAMYAYFMRLKSTSKAVYTGAQLRDKTTELAALAAGGEDLSASGIDASTIAKLSGKLAGYMLMSPADIKSSAANYLSGILSRSMRASGASADEIRKLNGKKQCGALVHVISHLLLGNIWQSDAVRPFDLDNEQIKGAATLIGGFANLFVDLANEIIIAWLKTEDSYYSDYKPMTEAQQTAYRRVNIELSDGAVNGAIVSDLGETVAEIKDGKLVNVKDRWIGYTTCDDGDFFRLPADRDYQFQFDVTADETLMDVKISEYDVYTATAHPVFSKSIERLNSTDKVTLTLPRLADGYEVPSEKTGYGVSIRSAADTAILGDASLDGEVDIIDVTLIQRHDAQMITLPAAAVELADVDRDGEVTVVDETYISRWLCEIPSVEGIGEPIDG